MAVRIESKFETYKNVEDALKKNGPFAAILTNDGRKFEGILEKMDGNIAMVNDSSGEGISFNYVCEKKMETIAIAFSDIVCIEPSSKNTLNFVFEDITSKEKELQGEIDELNEIKNLYKEIKNRISQRIDTDIHNIYD